MCWVQMETESFVIQVKALMCFWKLGSTQPSFLVWKSPHYFSWSTLATFWKNDYLYKSAAMPLLSMQSTHYATCYFFIFFCLYLFIWVLSQIDTFMWNGIAKIVKKSYVGKSYCQKVGHDSHMRVFLKNKTEHAVQSYAAGKN